MKIITRTILALSQTALLALLVAGCSQPAEQAATDAGTPPPAPIEAPSQASAPTGDEAQATGEQVAVINVKGMT